jgi:hypothetical protein
MVMVFTSSLYIVTVKQYIWNLPAWPEASDQTLTEFLISAGEQRADEVLAARTVVPADFYDKLIAALDEGPQADPAVRGRS